MTLVKRLAVRERTEDLERASLSTWAALSAETKGRDRHEEPDALRTTFQVDRDRVVNAVAFRRLLGKTQAFVSAEGGRNRMRLTHALEVSQVARTIARGLRLNEDLTEAIALGHDLGHTPFGPAGEDALSVFTDEPFRHTEQGLRVVERLERGGRGLNLTWEVRDGILHHTGEGAQPATLEGQVVRWANRVACLNHDLQDAVRGGILAPDALPAAVGAVVGRTHSQRIATAVNDIVAASLDQPDVRMSRRTSDAYEHLAEFVARRVHERPAARSACDRAIYTLRSLAVYYLDHPAALPGRGAGDDPLVARVLDVVAGMTDEVALAAFGRFFLPGRVAVD